MARKAKTTLTPSGVKALKTPGFFGDSGAVGLYVQVQYRQKGKHTTGEKEGKPKLDRSHGIVRSWIFRFTSPVTKKVRWMGLGSCDVIPLAEARDLAKAARRLVTLGADPIEYRKVTEEAERQAYLREQASKMTFAACVDKFLPGKLEELPQCQASLAMGADLAESRARPSAILMLARSLRR